MRVDFDGFIKTVTEFTYSHADSKKNGTLLLLPTELGRLAIPGRLIRGCLRHHTFHAVAKKLLPKKLTLHDWRFNLLGGVLQPGDRNYDVLRDRHKYENHPFCSVWGCMEPVSIWGKIQFEFALAPKEVKPVTIHGQRLDIVQNNEVRREAISDPESYNEYINKLGTLKDTKQENKKREAEAKVARKEGREVEQDETPRADNSHNLPFSRQMTPRDTEMDHHFQLNDVTMVQLGLIVFGLVEFSKDPHLGAQAGINGGLVNMCYNVRIDRKEVGILEIDGRSGSIKLPPKLKESLDLFEKEFPTMDFSAPIFEKKIK